MQLFLLYCIKNPRPGLDMLQLCLQCRKQQIFLTVEPMTDKIAICVFVFIFM